MQVSKKNKTFALIFENLNAITIRFNSSTTGGACDSSLALLDFHGLFMKQLHVLVFVGKKSKNVFRFLSFA